MNMAALPRVGLFGHHGGPPCAVSRATAECPPARGRAAQAALKGAQASLQGGQITRSLAGARTQEVNAPRTQEVNAPLRTSSG